MKKKPKRKHAPQDTTLRNARASARRDQALARRIADLERTSTRIEASVSIDERLYKLEHPNG